MEGILIFDSTQIWLEDILPFVNSFCGGGGICRVAVNRDLI